MKVVKGEVEMWLLEKGFDDEDCGEFTKECEGKEVSVSFDDNYLCVDIDDVRITLKDITFEMMIKILEGIRIDRYKI